MMIVPVEASWLSAATTFHLALAALCSHRQPARRWTSPLALVSVLLAGAPWAFPTLAGVLAGLAAHAAWFAICVRVTPAVSASAAAPAPPAARATPPPARRAADTKPRGFVQTPILAVLQESTDIRTFRLARPEGFDFTPGQFLTLRVRADGKDVVRCYSISSPPAARGYLEISIRRQGLVSNALHAMARPGSLLSVRAPAGAFVYPGGDDRPLVLLAICARQGFADAPHSGRPCAAQHSDSGRDGDRHGLSSTIAYAVVTETIFSWPGMGKLVIDSIFALDRPVIVAYLMIMVCLFVTINLLVDLSYFVLDPRLRARRSA